MWLKHTFIPAWKAKFFHVAGLIQTRNEFIEPKNHFFFPSQVPRKCSVSLCISLSLYVLYFHGVTTEANGANSKVTGAALFSHRPKTKVALQRGKKGWHAILIEFSLSGFLLHCSLSPYIAFDVAKGWQSSALITALTPKWQHVSIFHVLTVNVDSLSSPHDNYFCFKTASWKTGMEQSECFLLEAHVSIAAQSVFICWGVVLVSALKSVYVCVCWGDAEKGDGMSKTWIEGWREGGWNKHLEVTQVDSGLVCSLYQWGPGPWALGVYLSSWGTTAHYSPPIMPHRAPFLCLNWGAVCALMNYSIYLLCRSEVCLEKLLQTQKCPRVHSLICANSCAFSLICLTLLINLFHGLFISAKDLVWFHC